MNGGSITASLDRIEAALERLEAVARDAEAQAQAEVPAADPPAAAPVGVDEAKHADLERRHLQLRTAVTASLARLDALIARDDT
jgi:hypothetical protein